MAYARRQILATYILVGMTLLWATDLPVATPQEKSVIVFTLDPARSQVAFTLGAVLHTVQGTFRVKQGYLQLDLANGTVSGECIIDATSGESGNRTRDRKMHKEVLESDRYTEIVFAVRQVQGQVALQGTSTIEVEGTLTIRGSHHPLTAPALAQVQGETFTFSTQFLIPYVEWGMQDPSTFILTVDKQVAVTFKAVGRLVR